MLSDQTWLEEDEERALKLLAIWYRTMRYARGALRLRGGDLDRSRSTSGMGSDTFTADQTRVAIEEFEFFPTDGRSGGRRLQSGTPI